MSDNRNHFNNQFLGEKVSLPAPSQPTQTPVSRKAPTTLVVVLIATIGSIVGAYLGAYGATGSLPFISSTQNVVINNPNNVINQTKHRIPRFSYKSPLALNFEIDQFLNQI